jgi:hypothetical protein
MVSTVDRTCEVVVVQLEAFQLVHLAERRRHRPAKLVPSHAEDLERGQLADVGGDCRRNLVVVED